MGVPVWSSEYMRTSPSIVPRDDDQDIYLVMDDFGGRLGRAWRETEPDSTERETLIRDLLDGQYSNPVRIQLQHRGRLVARRFRRYRPGTSPALRVGNARAACNSRRIFGALRYSRPIAAKASPRVIKSTFAPCLTRETRSPRRAGLDPRNQT